MPFTFECLSPIISGNSAAYTNFIARTSGLDSTHLSAYAGLLNGLTTDGLFNSDGTSNYLDVLSILATQDATTALLNLVSSSFATTTGGAVSFTADKGYTGFNSGSSIFLQSYNASTASAHMTQNSACMGYWAYDTPTTNAVALGLAGSGQDIYPSFSGSIYMRINDNPESGGFSFTNAAGFFLGNRDSSTGRNGYKNGTSIGSYGSTASGNFNNATFKIGGDQTSNFISGFVFGGSLVLSGVTTLADNLYSRLRTYMTAVGVP